MDFSDDFFKVYDNRGKLHSVMLSASLWDKIRIHVEPLMEALYKKQDPESVSEPLHEWEELKKFWDFKYPVCSDVQCGNCGIKTEDWENDAAKPFIFKVANIGGLVVFTCRSCGATVRKKHFKDHMCFEFSTGKCGG